MNEAIILAGGYPGSARQEASTLPNFMQLIKGKPFLDYIIRYLKKEGVQKIVFALGYQQLFIREYLTQHENCTSFVFSIEEKRMGTGGAIAMALPYCKNENITILNGDILFKVPLNLLLKSHLKHKAVCTVALKPMYGSCRYGLVEMDARHVIYSFQEKQFFKVGLINGGVYILNQKAFLQNAPEGPFSFENDFLKKQVIHQNIFGEVREDYYADVEERTDRQKAEIELS